MSAGAADRIRAKIRARAEEYRRGLYVLLVDEAGRWVAIVRKETSCTATRSSN